MRNYGLFTMVLMAAFGLASCATDSNQSVGDKVLSDFGLKERPEGYVSKSDEVRQRLDDIGAQELQRLNTEARHGEIRYQQDGLRGYWYKEVRVYESYYPIDAKAISRSTRGERGYYGFIDYSYRVYQSPRKQTRVEAQAEEASIPTEEEGRETYRYRFGAGGTWDGNKGRRTSNR